MSASCGGWIIALVLIKRHRTPIISRLKHGKLGAGGSGGGRGGILSGSSTQRPLVKSLAATGGKKVTFKLFKLVILGWLATERSKAMVARKKEFVRGGLVTQWEMLSRRESQAREQVRREKLTGIREGFLGIQKPA